MKLTLAENIRAFRKERRLTQDQLAEALGVTVGSVYKWESGQSVPELNMMVEIADFFDTSMDALLGYRMKDNSVAAVGQRLSEYCRVRNPEALAEAEKALKKHPNSFEVVHGCARVYAFFGVGSKDHSETRRALELFEQARRLISQNHDPEISEQTIIGEFSIKSSMETILGVVLAGLLYATLPLNVLFLAVGICFIISGISEMMIRYEHTPSPEPITLRLAVSDMKDGFQYLKGQKAILAIMGSALFINFFITPVMSNFIPYFIKTDLAAAPSYLFDGFLKPELWSSVFSVCMGASSLIGAAVLSARKQEEKCGHKVAVRLCVFAGVMVVLAAGYWRLVNQGVSINGFLLLFCAGCLAVGFLLSFINIPLNTTIQSRVERNKLSKVGSFLSVCSQGLIPIASVLAGAALQAFGSSILLAICAVGFTAAAVLMLANKHVQTI